jgi:hypothetical protein
MVKVFAGGDARKNRFLPTIGSFFISRLDVHLLWWPLDHEAFRENIANSRRIRELLGSLIEVFSRD